VVICEDLPTRSAFSHAVLDELLDSELLGFGD
jgi:hypothetical protein